MALDTSLFLNDTSSNTSVIDNSDASALGKDDFMAMFLEELSQQDPMNPMDSEKMLEQTMQMAQLESTANQTEVFEKMGEELEEIKTNSMASFIGKTAVFLDEAKYFGIEGGALSRVIYSAQEEYKGTVEIIDDDGEIIQTLEISGESGAHELKWDRYDRWGDLREDGIYSLNFNIKNNEDELIYPDFNNFKIEGLADVNGVSNFILGEDVLMEASSVDLIKN